MSKHAWLRTHTHKHKGLRTADGGAPERCMSPHPMWTAPSKLHCLGPDCVWERGRRRRGRESRGRGSACKIFRQFLAGSDRSEGGCGAQGVTVSAKGAGDPPPLSLQAPPLPQPRPRFLTPRP